MNQPLFGPRQAQPLDDILRQSEALDLDELMAKLDPSGRMKPDELDVESEKMAPIALALAMSDDGRQFLEWLADLTVRRPYSVRGMPLMEAGTYARGRDMQNGVFFAIAKAIAAGEAQIKAARERHANQGAQP